MTDWTDRELAAERQMLELGIERYRAKARQAQDQGRMSYGKPATAVVREHLARIVAGLREWLKHERTTRRPGPQHAHPAFGALSAANPKAACLIALRSCLDLTATGATYTKIVAEIGRRVEIDTVARSIRKAHPREWETLRSRLYTDWATVQRRLTEAARETGATRWPKRTRVQVGVLLVDVIERTSGLVRVDTLPAARSGGTRIRSRHVLTVNPAVTKWIDERHATMEGMEPMYLPMVQPPADWGPNQPGGYATDVLRREFLVKAQSRKTRTLVAEADMPAVYRAVNVLQRTEWELNPVVLEAARHLWDHDTPALPRELPVPEFVAGAHENYVRTRMRGIAANAAERGRRLELSRVLWAAATVAKRDSPSLYFPQQLDFRGRVYPMPGFLNPQGGDLARGLLQFRRGCFVVDGTPEASALLQHGARLAGLDKRTLAEREQWARDKRDLVVSVARDPLEHRQWEEVDEPWQFLAWCLDAAQLFESGRSWSKVPCHVDGSNNGLQILSLLLRDPAGAAATNCIPASSIRDVYQDVADVVTARLTADDTRLARRWLRFAGGAVPRQATKRAVMTLPYGCTEWSGRQYVAEWVDDRLLAGEPPPWDAPDGRWPAIQYLAALVWDAIKSTVGPAMAAMDWLREVAESLVAAGVAPVWVTPSGFPVRQGYTNYQVALVRTMLGDRVRWVNLRKHGDKLSLRRHRQALPPNFVHSLDAAVLCLAVSRAADRGVDQVTTVHDSFGAPASQIGLLAQAVRSTYADVFSRDLLANLKEQLDSAVGSRYTLPDPPPRGDLDPGVVRHSTYLFS